MPVNVRIIGDSQLKNISSRDFHFDGRVDINSSSGSGIAYAEQIMADIEWSTGSEVKPDIIVIFIGGNDLDRSDANIHDLVSRFVVVAQEAEAMGALTMFMEQWPRPGARNGPITYTTNKEYFEYRLRSSLPKTSRLWRWDKSLRINDGFFARDGVHFHPRRKRKVIRYLLSAVLAAARWDRRLGLRIRA